MYYYIYRINDILKSELKKTNVDSLNKINSNLFFEKFLFENINGFIKINNDSIPFEIDLKYSFLFIKTEYQNILNKCLKIIEPFFMDNFGGELENFLPRVSKEHDLICNSKKFNLKFSHNGRVIDCDDDENLERKYCDSKLSKDYILLEADITLKNGLSFVYLRKCLNIDDESKEFVLSEFKKVMA